MQAGQALGIEMLALEAAAGTRALFQLGVMLRGKEES
jgi:hypothetical protein